MSFTELAQQWPVITEKGPGHCVAVIDYGAESHLILVCVQNDTGQIWCCPNPRVRFAANWTMGRKSEHLLPK